MINKPSGSPPLLMYDGSTTAVINNGKSNGANNYPATPTLVAGVPVSALLELQSVKGGLLKPRMTTVQMNALVASPGLEIFNTDEHAPFVYISTGDGWVQIGLGTGNGDVVGPGSSVENNIATFANDTGKLIQDSGVNITQVPPPAGFGITATNVPEISGFDFLAFQDQAGIIKVNNEASVLLAHDVISDTLQTVFLEPSSGSLFPTNTSCLVELQSTKGALVNSRMNTAQLNALIAAPGMQAYNNQTNMFNFYNGSGWITLANILDGGSTGQLFIGTQTGNLTSGLNNVGIGYQALMSNPSGSNNFGLGSQALSSITSAQNCIGIGTFALLHNVIGNRCIALGIGSLTDSTGDDNVGVGFNSLGTINSGTANTACGSNSFQIMATGSNNASLGYNTGINSTVYNSCTMLGAGADVTASNPLNSCAVGANAKVSVNNAIVLGNNTFVGIGTAAPSYLFDLRKDGAGPEPRLHMSSTAIESAIVAPNGGTFQVNTSNNPRFISANSNGISTGTIVTANNAVSGSKTAGITQFPNFNPIQDISIATTALTANSVIMVTLSSGAVAYTTNSLGYYNINSIAPGVAFTISAVFPGTLSQTVYAHWMIINP